MKCSSGPMVSFFWMLGLILLLTAVVFLVAWNEYVTELFREPVEKVPSLHGKDKDDVIARYGEPDCTIFWKIEEIGDEFRGELLNFYPPDHPRNANVEILEMQWHYELYSVAVWCHRVNGKWVVLNTCRWQKNIAF